MSNDLYTQLSEYGSQTREAREPVSATHVANRVDQVQVIAVVQAPNGRRGWHVAVAAAAATFLILGGVAWLAPFGGSTPSADEPTVTAISDEITTPETTVPLEPSEPVGPVVVDDSSVFDEILDDERMANNPTIQIGPDGLPVIVYWSEDFFGESVPEGLRMVRCADLACSEYQITAVSATLSGFWADPPVAYLPDGAPVFVEAGSFPGATEGTGMVDGLAELHVCTDAICSGGETTVLETVDYPDLILNVPQVLIGDLGLPVLIFQSDAPPAVNSIKVMTCGDRACTASTVTTLFDEAWGPQAYVSETGGLILLYRDLANGWHAITCAALDCSDGATAVPVDEAMGLVPGGVTPILSGGGPDDEGFEVCFGPSCSTIDGVGGGGTKAVVGSDGLLLLIHVPVDFLPVDFQTESVGLHLLVTKCADASCSEHTTVQVASLISDEDLALGRFVVGSTVCT